AVVVDGNGRIVFFNAAAERLWARDRLDTVGHAVADDLPQLAALFVQHRADGHLAEFTDLPIGRADGSGATASVAISEVSLRPGLRLALARDMTAEVHAREQLRLLALAADRTDRGVIISDSNHRIVFVNRSFLDLLGYSSSEVLGKDAYTLFTGPTASPETMAELRRNVESGTGFHQEMPVRDRNGRSPWLYGAVNPVADANGAMRHVVASSPTSQR